MKPWEEDWKGVEVQEESKKENIKQNIETTKPWEEDWNDTEFNIKDYNGTYLIGEPGQDIKPFDRIKLFVNKLGAHIRQIGTFKVETGEIVKERRKNDSNIQVLEKIRDEGFDVVDWGEVSKAGIKGTLQLAQGLTAEPFKIYGDFLKDTRDLSTLPLHQKIVSLYNNVWADMAIQVGTTIEGWWNAGINSDFLREDEKIFSGDFVDNPSLTRVMSLGASAMPSLAFGGAIGYITKSPTLGAVLLSGADSTDIYWGAREAGKSSREALGLFATSTAGTAVMEKFGLDQLYEKKMTTLSKQIVGSILSEGLTEGGQTVYQNMIKKYGYDDTQMLMEGVLESMIGGAVSGGVMSTALGGYNKLMQARDNLKVKGVENQSLDIIQEAFADEITRHRETIDPVFQENVTHSLNSLNKLLEENQNTYGKENDLPDVAIMDNKEAQVEQTLQEGETLLDQLLKQKAVSLSDELQARVDDVKDTLREQAINNGIDEQEAEATAQLGALIVRKAVEEAGKLGINIDEAVEQTAFSLEYDPSRDKFVNQNFEEISPKETINEEQETVLSPEEAAKEAEEERIAIIMEQAKVSEAEARFILNTGRIPTLFDKQMGYDYIPYQLAPEAYVNIPVKITGVEFGKYTGDKKVYGKHFADYYKKNIGGTSVISPVLGEVKFFNGAINETIAKNISTPENLKYIAAVPKIIETSTNVEKEKIKHKKSDIIGAWKVTGQVDINGDIRNISIIVLEDKRHNKYYTFDARQKIALENTAVQGGNQRPKTDNSIYDNSILQDGHDVNKPLYQAELVDKSKLNLEVNDFPGDRIRNLSSQRQSSDKILRVMGEYRPLEKVITLFKGRDKTTFTHEMLHHYLPIYLRLLEQGGKWDQLRGLYEILGVDNMSRMNREQWEQLVDYGTSYIFYGEAPNAMSKSIFEQAKQWMIDAYNTVKRFINPSDEIRKFYDDLLSGEELPDVTNLKGKTEELAKILQGAKNGQELTINGLSLRDISRLRQVLYARIPAAGKSLADVMREAGGIDTESEMAKQLGYDSRKGTETGFWNYKGAIKDESQLIGFLRANGYLENISETSYEDTSSVWNKVQDLIDKRNDTYNERERIRQMRRDSAFQAQQTVSELLDEHYIGDVKKLENDLKAVTKMLSDRGAVAVDKATLDYLTFAVKRMGNNYRQLLYQKKEERYDFQDQLTKFIKELPLDYKHKSKFMDKIRMVKDERTFNKYLKEVRDRTENYVMQEQRQLYSDLIQSEIKNSRPRKVMAQRYDYENNVLFKDLRDYNKLNQSEAAITLSTLDEREQNVDNPGSRGYLLRRLFLEYKTKGMDSSPELMQQLYTMISEAKQLGRQSKEEKEFEQSFEREHNRQQIINKLIASKADKNKINTQITNIYRRGITNLYSMLNSIAGKEVADKYEMETVVNAKEQKEWRHLKETNAKAETIYKVNSYGDLLNVMSEKGQVVGVLYGRLKEQDINMEGERYDKNLKYDVSIMDIIDIYNAIKNKKTKEDYNRAYGADQINRLISLLSSEDRAFGDMLMEDVNSRFTELNSVYIRTYGMDLKKVDDYWMGSAEHIQPIDIVNDFHQQSTTPGFFKEKTTAPITPIAKNAWIKYQKHISQSYYMTEVAEKYKQMADVFKSSRIKNLIENRYGSSVFNTLHKQIENIGLNAQSPRLDDVSGYFQKLLNNWVGAKVSVNPIVFVGQLTSFTNYAEGVKTSDFIKNVGYALVHPIEVKDFMMKYNGNFLRHRYESGFNEAMTRFINDAQETSGRKLGLSAKAKFTYSKALSSFVRAGDLGAIIYGGYGQFKTLLDSGLSMEEAKKKFEFSTLRSQQSGNTASISDWQQQRGIARLYLAFKNTSMQYTRKIADTVIMLQNGDINSAEAAKVLTNYVLIQPALWVIAKNIVKSLLGLGDDDDKYSDGVLEQLLVNPVDAVPFISDMIRYTYREATGERNYSLFSTPLLDDVEKSFRKIGKKDKDVYDFADIMIPFIEMLTSAPAGTAKRYVKMYNEKWGN